MRISGCLVVKDEEKFLPECLRSISGAFDEIIAVDTGSSDSTRDVLAEWGPITIGIFPWKDDYSAARNYADSLATGDWTVHIDADERLMRGQGPLMRQLLEKAPDNLHGLAMWCYSPLIEGTMVHSVLRIRRNRSDIYWEGRAHESFEPSLNRLEADKYDTPLGIWHEGYRQNDPIKLERNLRLLLLQLAESETPRLHFDLGRTLRGMGNLDDARQHLERALSTGNPNDGWYRVCELQKEALA